MGQKASTPLESLDALPDRSHEANGNAVQSPHDSAKALVMEGSFAAAVDLAQHAVEKNKTRLGLEHPLTLACMFELGKALHGDGRIEKALHVFQELLPLNEKVHGLAHDCTLETLDAICQELCNMGKYEQSLLHLDDERQRYEQVLGLENERTIRVLVDIANMSKLLGKIDEASLTFSLALGRSKNGLGDRHHITLGIRNDIRGLKGPVAPTLEQMKSLLRQKHLPIPAKPFPIYLQQLRGLLNDSFWGEAAFFWVDWTCLPQWTATAPRTAEEEQYFRRVLASIPRLVRDCSFLAQFHDFRSRLWVLFEVAAFTFSRAEPVGLPCTDIFKKHLSQMKGDGVRIVLDKYQYNCTNKGDREWVITQLEILLALRKTVPSIHTRRQILDAIDNSVVRYCDHKEVNVEIDEERGVLKAGETTYQFNPLPVDDGIPDSVSEVRIAGDHAMQLERALRRAGQSVEDTGIGEMAREYGRAGDHKIAEVLHRLALERCDDPVNSHDLLVNLENQERVWQSQDPMVMKSIEEQALESEERGRFSEAQLIHLSLLEQRKASLGPCHIDTRRSICNLARSFRLGGNAEGAHLVCAIALAICDFSLGPWHPESRAVLGNLAEAVLLRGKPGLARGYFRQHLERTLAITERDDPEAFPPKFFLHALVQEGELLIVQGEEGATVQIMGYAPQDTGRLNSNPALAMAAGGAASSILQEVGENDTKGGGQSHHVKGGGLILLDLEKADFIFNRYIIARTS
ncbi:hypothetical protein MFIFM68171_02814 [Madurella fahalii]|uniref:Uncharacterized protein n=1 Tax=Madurella fahalii TaxID=1157608 RepID=A0ABQ0G4C2_9PEZI